MAKIWFKAKEYGWGWRPKTWQGWIVLLIYTIILIINLMNMTLNPGLSIASLLVSTLCLLAICYRKGEKPRWRWGENGERDRAEH